MEVISKTDGVLEEYVAWHGSDDAADSTADDLDAPCRYCEWEPEGDARHDDADHEYEPGPRWEPTGEYGIYIDGDCQPLLPDEDAPEEWDQPVWNVGEVQSDDRENYRYGDLATSLTLAEAVRVAQEDLEINLDTLIGAGPWIDVIRAQIRRDVGRYDELIIQRVGSSDQEPVYPQDAPELAGSKIWALLGLHDTDHEDCGFTTEVIEESLTVAEATELARKLGWRRGIIGLRLLKV
jgi:hypothetical protein